MASSKAGIRLSSHYKDVYVKGGWIIGRGKSWFLPDPFDLFTFVPGSDIFTDACDTVTSLGFKQCRSKLHFLHHVRLNGTDFLRPISRKMGYKAQAKMYYPRRGLLHGTPAQTP